MIENRINELASRIASRLSGELNSIVAYSHPFTNGGLVIVFRDEVGFLPDLIAEVYECDPPAITLHFLRRRELFQLSDPGVFGWPNQVEEKPLLAWCVKFKGSVLYGDDIRREVTLPTDTMALLGMQLQRCRQFARNWALDQFRRRNYGGIVEGMDSQLKHLMAISLLPTNGWDVPLDEIPESFERIFEDAEMNHISREIKALAVSPDQSRSRETAMEAVWLFERGLQKMGTFFKELT